MSQDSTSDEEEFGSATHFMLHKPSVGDSPFNSIKHHKEKDNHPSNYVYCSVVTIVVVIVTMTATVTYTAYIHSYLGTVETLLHKLKDPTLNASDVSVKDLRLSGAQMKQLKSLLNVADFAQIRNLSNIHKQFLALQKFYRDVDDNPSIVQFLGSITQQLTPLSQSVVLMSDGFLNLQKTVRSLETDRDLIKESLKGLTAIIQKQKLTIESLRNSTGFADRRLSILELTDELETEFLKPDNLPTTQDEEEGNATSTDLHQQNHKLKDRIDALEEKLHNFLSTRGSNSSLPNPSPGKESIRKGGKIRQH